MNFSKVLPYFRISSLIVCTILILVSSVNAANETNKLTISTHDIELLVDEKAEFKVLLEGVVSEAVNVTFIKQHANLVDIVPPWIDIEPSSPSKTNFSVEIFGRNRGHLEITVNTDPKNILNSNTVFLRVTIGLSWTIANISFVFGWVYFIAWSVSFYPQIYTNFRRKSVIGLNFDFLSLNIVGFILYSLFNVGLYWSPEIQSEYSQRYPRGLNPVLINDVFFSIHAALATILTIFQCFIYERGDQRVSLTARGILTVFMIVIIVTVGLAFGNIIHWLDFLYYCSYIKLTITLIKYVPQAVMNYKRKSTVGWSIGNILLDFTGGVLSMLQMILNAQNYDDWDSIFGDPTKFGLGLFSVCFDIFFMLQHYVFYRNASKELSESETTTVDDEKPPKKV